MLKLQLAKTFTICYSDTLSKDNPTLPPVLSNTRLTQWIETVSLELMALYTEEPTMPSIGTHLSIQQSRPLSIDSQLKLTATLQCFKGRQFSLLIIGTFNEEIIIRGRHQRTLIPPHSTPCHFTPEALTLPSSLITDNQTLYQHYLDIASNRDQALIDSWRNQTFHSSLWNDLAAAGLFQMLEDEDDTTGLTQLACALKAIGQGSKDTGYTAAIISHAGLSIPVIEKHGSQHVREHYLTKLRTGKHIAAFAITEPQGGSAAKDIHTQLVPTDDGHFLLNGEKWHVNNAPVANLILTFAKRPDRQCTSALLVNPNWEGVWISDSLPCMGLRTSPVGQIRFDQVLIPENHILGQPEDGSRILAIAFILERLLVPWGLIGIGRQVLSEVLEYARKRKVGRQRLSQYQYIQGRITDVRIALDSAEGIAQHALTRFCRHEDASLQASMAKIQAAKALHLAASHAIQILGSYGLQENRRYAQILSDALGGCIAGGTEEVHRRVIFNNMMREQARQGTYHRSKQSKAPSTSNTTEKSQKPTSKQILKPENKNASASL